jgi:hypothetical protein
MSRIRFTRRASTALALVLSLSASACDATGPAPATQPERSARSVHAAVGLTAQNVVPAYDGISHFTPFDPAVHGLKFVNDFSSIVAIGQFNGLCGGMSYTALDYYFANQTVPQQNYRPEENTPFQQYIYNRQEDSIEKNFGQWVSWLLNSGENNTSIQANSFAQQFGIVQASIDKGIPIPLGLDSTKIFGHQVVAIGYELGESELDNKIYLYNPNYPGQIVTLVWDSGAQVFTMAEYPLADTYVGYFADTAYSPVAPPTVPEPIYPDDGLIHEIFLRVLTGNDPLQNGGNASLAIELTDGTELTFPGLNLNEKWLSNYLETVRIPLPTPLDPHTISELMLSETDSCGPWDIQYAVAQAVGATTWVLAVGDTSQIGSCQKSEPLYVVQAPPVVNSVSTNGAPAGATITISGAGFHTDGSTSVNFGSTAVRASCASSTSCTAVVPSGVGEVALTVTEPAVDSNLVIDNPPASASTFSASAGKFWFQSVACTYTPGCGGQVIVECTPPTPGAQVTVSVTGSNGAQTTNYTTVTFPTSEGSYNAAWLIPSGLATVQACTGGNCDAPVTIQPGTTVCSTGSTGGNKGGSGGGGGGGYHGPSGCVGRCPQ